MSETNSGRSLLEHIVAGNPNASSSVIWLHGLGADGHDFVPIVPELGFSEDSIPRFIFPHAPVRPVTVNGGMSMRAWYDIRSIDLDARSQDVEGIRSSAEDLEALIHQERERGVPSNKIVLAGFSQGGALALYAGLRHREKLAGIIGLSCYLLLSDALASEADPSNRSTPIFLAHGTGDPVVPHFVGKQSYDTLIAAGYECEWHEYPMPHAVHPNEISAIASWLQRVLDP